MTEQPTEYTTDQSLALNTLSALVTQTFDRLSLARSLQPSAYNGARRYNTVLGYPDEIFIENYWSMYQRGGIASTIVDLPAEDTWKKPPAISEPEDRTDTAFVQAWDELVVRHRIWSLLTRADRLSGIGQFGVILIGVRDGRAFHQPVDRDELTGDIGRDILYYRPISELRAEIATFDERISSRRFGFPETYRIGIRENRVGGEKGEAGSTQVVHWTRVIHLADNKLDSSVYGVPRLRGSYNTLMDLLFKILGGTAEAIWLEIRKGLIIRPQEGYELTPADKAEVQNQIEKWVHDMARVMNFTGMEAQDVGNSTVPDSTGAFSNAIGIIAATTKIPQRKLLGSAQGELSAAQEDTRQWFGVVASRQTEYAQPDILETFINWHINNGILPTPEGGPKAYDIGQLGEDGQRHWPSLFELTDQEQADISNKKATAANALRNPVTGATPLTEGEERLILGVPEEKPEPEQPRAVNSLATNDGLSDYGLGIRAAVRGAWTGKFDEFTATEGMIITIQRAMRRAWIEGAKKVGISENELTEAELSEAINIANEQSAFVLPFIRAVIEGKKGTGTKLGKFITRSSKWLMVYGEVVNKAMLTARDDPKFKWVLNLTTKEHCISALKLQDKVKRASQWNAAGIRPQSPDLECMSQAGGTVVCTCKFVQTDEPLSRGRLPRLP